MRQSSGRVQANQLKQEEKRAKEKREAEEGGDPIPIKATLLVVPANLLPQW